MGNDVQALPVDTINGCVIKGKYKLLPDRYYELSRVQFEEGISVYLPKQTSKDAVISCVMSNDGNSVSVSAENLSGVTIFGSDQADNIRAINCKNCIFDTNNDGNIPDSVSIYNGFGYAGKNKIYLGENDKANVEQISGGQKTTGIFDATSR